MIKTPNELLEYMSDFEYKWMDKDGNFHEDIIPEMYENYSLMTPEEVEKYKCGICVDQTEFERDWFFRHNYDFKIMVIEIDRFDSKPGHQFLIYKENNKYYWFENAWGDERGIHEYKTYEELIDVIKNKFIIQNDIKDSEFSNLRLFEQVKYPYHLSYEEMDEYKYKEEIADICENLYRECLKEIPQYQNGELIWFLNGSTLCNILYNVVKIDDIVVSDEFKKYCYQFIRQPKGDIDITYKPDRPYKFNLDNEYIKKFQYISEERRTYNFVDSNSELTDSDLKELCTMETKNGLKFVAKRPEYLFLYKFKEFLAQFSNEIFNNDLESINKRKKNILCDVLVLYKMAISYSSKEQIDYLLSCLPNKSSYLNKLYNHSHKEYEQLIKQSLEIIDKNVIKK